MIQITNRKEVSLQHVYPDRKQPTRAHLALKCARVGCGHGSLPVKTANLFNHRVDRVLAVPAVHQPAVSAEKRLLPYALAVMTVVHYRVKVRRLGHVKHGASPLCQRLEAVRPPMFVVEQSAHKHLMHKVHKVGLAPHPVQIIVRVSLQQLAELPCHHKPRLFALLFAQRIRKLPIVKIFRVNVHHHAIRLSFKG